jgi:hypothetical protein
VTAFASRRAVLTGAVGLSLDCAKQQSPTAERATTRSGASGAPGVPALAGLGRDAGRELEPANARALFVEKELDFAASPVGPEKAIAIVPRWGDSGARFPVLVALHGSGEAVRGIEVGARGWLRDYDIGRTITRLRSPPLFRDDFKGFVDAARLLRINASLAERPFRGLIVACPWVPDLVSEKDRSNLDAPLPFGRFVVEDLLPRIAAETPALSDRASTGIDGVSLGGRVALVVGLAHPGRFAAIGTLQAAIQDNEPPALVKRAREAMGDADRLRLRLVTSDQDYFRSTIGALHLALKAGGIEHEHLVIPGPHDYAFNRGPGGIEMLLWHDRVLRGEPPL